LTVTITAYWRDKTYEETVVATYPPELRARLYPPSGNAWCMSTHYRYPNQSSSTNFETLYAIGINGIHKRIDARIDEINKQLASGNNSSAKLDDLFHRRNELTAMKIASEAFAQYVERYSKLASDTAAKEQNPTRKAELEYMAKNLTIREPIKTYYQAIQIMWLDHIVCHVFETQGGGVQQRIDLILYPYYKKEIEGGTLTREKAKELLMEMWYKYERGIGRLDPPSNRVAALGNTTLFQNITLGGVDSHGKDVTNDITYLALEVTKELRGGSPTLSVRYHPGIPDELIMASWDVLKTGQGMPAFYNDKPTIEHYLEMGVTLEDARNHCISGCVSQTIHGKTVIGQNKVAAAFNAAKFLEQVLNDGVDPMSGKQEGPKTGDPRNFKSYEELMNAYHKQAYDHMWLGWAGSQISRKVDSWFNACPYMSSMDPTCVREGLDVREYCEYNWPFFGCGSGMIDAADSLAAIKKLVFEEKKVTMDDMLKALKANFVGYDNIYKLCIEAPKFGQDDDYADLIARDLFDWFDGTARNFKDYEGGRYDIQYHSVSTFMFMGMMTGALPDGRKARMPLADGGASPELGFGKDPTKVLNSVSKLNHSKTQRILLNSRLSPNTTPRQFVDLIRAWGDLGLSQIQFNVFKTETLRDAQKTPDEYSDLLVRVAGFSAVFVNLNPVAQETIMSRSELTAPKSSC
jgi:formate C-acetyltransferase